MALAGSFSLRVGAQGSGKCGPRSVGGGPGGHGGAPEGMGAEDSCRRCEEMMIAMEGRGNTCFWLTHPGWRNNLIWRVV